ncbi:hypothetical protein KAM338_26970 [Aeromonas caviae]|nr:hypothetical protein KAM338_26970 [Aeromonas caviae]
MEQTLFGILLHAGKGLPGDDQYPEQQGEQAGQQRRPQPGIKLAQPQTTKRHTHPRGNGEKADESTPIPFSDKPF